jgi:hypothetical protein
MSSKQKRKPMETPYSTLEKIAKDILERGEGGTIDDVDLRTRARWRLVSLTTRIRVVEE